MLGTLSVTKEVTPEELNTAILTIWKNDRVVTDWAKGVYSKLLTNYYSVLNTVAALSVNNIHLYNAASSLEKLTDLVRKYKELKRLAGNRPS